MISPFLFLSCPSLSLYSGCPEAVKLLVGNKSDLPPEVDLSQARVSTPRVNRWLARNKVCLTADSQVWEWDYSMSIVLYC